MTDSKWSGAVRRSARRFVTAAVVLMALSLVLTPTTVAAQAPPAASCAGETTVVLVDMSADTDLSAAYLLAEVLRTDCLVDAGPRTDSELPAASAALLATAGLRFGYVVGGPAAVSASKLTAAVVWRRAAGADRWATLRAVAAAAADPTTLPKAETANPTNIGTGSASDSRYSAVSAGDFHTCALRTDGALLCWGRHDHSERLPPSPVGKFTRVTAGHSHTCALRTDGTVACWGTPWGHASPPAGQFIQVSAGGEHTCALRVDRTIACWGSDQSKQQWPSGGKFTQVSVGVFQTCALRTNGTIVCWGSDHYGQVSDVPSGSFTQVSAAGFQTCAVRASGRAVCWGSDNSDWFDTVTGQSASPPGKFTRVSAGGGHTCGLRTDGTVVCWGDDKFGQASLSLPQIVAVYAIPDGVSAVSTRPQGISDAIEAAQSWFRSQTGGRHPVFARDSDGIDVRTVRLGPAPPNEKRGEANARILQEVRSALGLRGWESVAVWLEGRLDGPGDPACAWAGSYVMVPIWNCGTNVPESGTRWPSGGSRLTAHELTHLLGAASDCAPNVHDDSAHVTDDPSDIIYRGHRGPPASGDYVLDVGRDDYFGHGRDDCYDISNNPLLRIE